MFGGPEVRMRSVLLQAGVSFYEFEKEPAHHRHLDDDNSRLITEMGFEMFRFGISLQDLKKDTLYEDLEEEGWSKEDIEKEVKAVYNMDDNKQEENKEFNAQIDSRKNECSIDDVKEEEKKGKVWSDAEWREYLRRNYYDDPHVQKDIEMYGDLNAKALELAKKELRKFQEIEKEKQKKLAGRMDVQSATIDMINT